jgi:hypothetical protein
MRDVVLVLLLLALLSAFVPLGLGFWSLIRVRKELGTWRIQNPFFPPKPPQTDNSVTATKNSFGEGSEPYQRGRKDEHGGPDDGPKVGGPALDS